MCLIVRSLRSADFGCPATYQRLWIDSYLCRAWLPSRCTMPSFFYFLGFTVLQGNRLCLHSLPRLPLSLLFWLTSLLAIWDCIVHTSVRCWFEASLSIYRRKLPPPFTCSYLQSSFWLTRLKRAQRSAQWFSSFRCEGSGCIGYIGHARRQTSSRTDWPAGVLWPRRTSCPWADHCQRFLRYSDPSAVAAC